MNRLSVATALSCMILATSCPVVAGDGLVEKYSDDSLVQILKNDGYSAVDKIRDGAIRVKVDGTSFVFFNQSDGDLQLYYSIGGAQVSHEDINEWNRTKRLSRAYLDSDKDPTLEADLLANGGLTEKHVTEFFKVFKISANRFRDFIIEHLAKE